MVRVFIDELGTGHKDIYLKVDNSPEYFEVGDSYYFRVNIDQKEDFVFSQSIKEFIENWERHIKKIKKKQVVFLPFGIYDQSIRGLKIESINVFGKQDILFMEIGYISEGAYGNSSDFDLFNWWDEIKRKFIKDKGADWLISKQSFLEGIKWSIEKLDK